ncbi:hypothetical protein QQ045_018244 [Rhodiola kirilowii]
MATDYNVILLLSSLVILSLVLLSINAANETNGCYLLPTMHVHITNKIGPSIRVHCRSRDDDLGDHTLAYGQDYHFAFKPFLFGGTKFWCSVEWDGKIKSFDAFRQERDFYRCRIFNCNCPWTLTPERPCFSDVCIPWNGEKLLNAGEGESGANQSTLPRKIM